MSKRSISGQRLRRSLRRRLGNQRRGEVTGRRWRAFEQLEPRWMLSWAQDDFTGTTINPATWAQVDQDQTYSSGSVIADSAEHLRVTVSTNSTTGQVAREYVASVGSETNQSWTYYSSASFSATATNRADVRLGYRFEMSDSSSYAYLQFDSRDGMKLRYGSTATAPQDGPSLHPSQWYELKFAWDATSSTLRGWYRETGRAKWLGGTNDTGYVLYSSTAAYPERLNIGQAETTTLTSSSSLTMTLLVDYWRQTEPPIADVGIVTDGFDTTPPNPALWQDQDYAFSSLQPSSVGSDSSGALKVQVHNYYGNNSACPMSQAYLETLPRFSNAAWTAYTAVAFTADRVGREDLDLGYRFDMSDGKSYAYLCRHCELFAVLKSESSGVISLLNLEVNACSP